MKNINTTLKSELAALTDTALDRAIKLRGTDFDRTVRFSSRTKNVWKQLYKGTGVIQMSISEIADAWDTTPMTVRRAVDPEYDAKIRQYKKDYHQKHYKEYYEKHKNDHTPEERNEMRMNRIKQKRSLVNSPNLSHLKAL